MDEAHTIGSQLTNQLPETLIAALFRANDELVVITQDGRKFVFSPEQANGGRAALVGAAETAALAAVTALTTSTAFGAEPTIEPIAEPIAEPTTEPDPAPAARAPRRRGAGAAHVKSEIEE
jgi:hypothetical protein